MKTKRFFALVCVSLTLLTLSVGVFAYQPPIQSPFVDYGAYQIGDFNSQYTCQVVSSSLCSCGAFCYEYVIADSEIPDEYRGGSVFAIIDPTSLNRGFNGLYNVLPDNHTEADHSINNCYRPYTSGAQYILTTRELTVSASTRYTLLCVDSVLAVDSGLRSFVNTEVTSVTAHTGYSFSLVSASPVQSYIDDQHSNAIRLAYNDGQINGSRNADLINGADSIFEDVRIALTPLLEFEVLGVSVISFVSLLVTFSIIMIIIKVVRG